MPLKLLKSFTENLACESRFVECPQAKVSL